MHICTMNYELDILGYNTENLVNNGSECKSKN